MAMQINDILNSTSANRAAKDVNGLATRFGESGVNNSFKNGFGAQEDVMFEPSSRVAEAYRSLSVSEHYQYSETMTLQLTTREGDKVEIDYRQLYAEYQSRSEFENVQARPEGVRYFSSKEVMESSHFEEHIGFSVTGDLNDQELQAIYDVFEKVDALANHFYAGDIELAFQKAMELDVDLTQIGSLNVSMTQTEMKAVQYQQVAMAEYAKAQREALEADSENEEHQTHIGELPDYLQKWQAALEKLDAFFENANEQLTNLTAGVTAQRFPEQDSESGWLDRVKALHQNLLEQHAEVGSEKNSAEQDSQQLDAIA